MGHAPGRSNGAGAIYAPDRTTYFLRSQPGRARRRLRSLVRKTSVNLPDDIADLMERAAASVGQSTTQFVREAVLLRCAVAGGEVTDEIRALAAALRKG